MAASGPPGSLSRELAPTGELRIAINLGNSIVVARSPVDGALSGKALEIGAAIAAPLGLAFRLVEYPSAKAIVDDFPSGRFDIALLARDARRQKDFLFSLPYITIPATYLVRTDSPLVAMTAVDSEGVTIASGAGSAYDLFLSRKLRNATLRRYETTPAAIEAFLRSETMVLAGLGPMLQSTADRHGGFRLIPGSYFQIEQAVALPIGLEEALAFVDRQLLTL